MNRPTELIPIDDIVVGDRLREDYGDIDGLANSIMEHGLFHPLTVDADSNLVAGERRLRALKQLGFLEVEVRRWNTLTELERRELELEENIRRKDLTEIERSRKVVEVADLAKSLDIQRTAESQHGSTVASGKNVTEFRATPARNSTRGRPPEPGSLRRQSDITGIPIKTIDESRTHAAIADKFPMIGAIHKTDAVKMERKLSVMKPEEREATEDKIRQNDVPTIAKLVDKEVPASGSPQDVAAYRAGRLWRSALQDIMKKMSSVKRTGGVAVVAANWSPSERREILERTDGMIAYLTEFRDDLKGLTRESQV